MQDGTIFHITAFRNLSKCPFQQAKTTTTQLGITHTNLTRLKIVFDRALVISQYSKSWSIDSPLFLHIQHQSTTITCRFLRLPIVKIFPKVVDQAKYATLSGALLRQILLQHKGNECYHREQGHFSKNFHQEFLLEGT